MKYFKLLILPLLLIIASCNESSEPSETAIQVPEGWLELDISQTGTHYGLPMLINIPDENLAKGISEIMEGPSGGTQIKAGNDFNLEITTAPFTIAEKKEEIERNPLFKITYLSEEPNEIFYKAEIEGSDIVQHHFYSVKEIKGEKYAIENIKDEDYSEAGIKRMIEASKSLRAKS